MIARRPIQRAATHRVRVVGPAAPGFLRGWLSGALLLVVHLIALGALPASANEGANAKIPPNAFGCALCHDNAVVSFDAVPAGAESPLTSFGTAWKQLAALEADRVWEGNRDILDGNADADGCSNGYELGDPNGEYAPGDPFTLPSPARDPSASDCALPVDDESWSTLKSLFSDGR